MFSFPFFECVLNQSKKILEKEKATLVSVPVDFTSREENNVSQYQAYVIDDFSLQKVKNYLLIPANNPQKTVVYKILEQKLLDKNKYEKNKKHEQPLYNLRWRFNSRSFNWHL